MDFWVKKKRSYERFFLLQKRALLIHKFRICFHAAVDKIEAFLFFYGADPNSHYRLDNHPSNETSSEDPAEDRQHSDQLAHKSCIRV